MFFLALSVLWRCQTNTNLWYIYSPSSLCTAAHWQVLSIMVVSKMFFEWPGNFSCNTSNGHWIKIETRLSPPLKSGLFPKCLNDLLTRLAVLSYLLALAHLSKCKFSYDPKKVSCTICRASKWLVHDQTHFFNGMLTMSLQSAVFI